MTFNAVNLQFKALADFATWLAKQPAPTWRPVGTTFHNTYKPTIDQWRGLASMESMQAGYIKKGWTVGPHVYLAHGAPNPDHDGIFVMTPPTHPGVHSPSCNHARFGVEVVGDFQAQAPTTTTLQLLIDTVAALHEWAGLGPNLNAHRDCDPRTCPGDAFYALKPQLRARLGAALAPNWDARWGPIATPTAVSWSWDIPRAWKQQWQRLGKCISSALYDDASKIAVQAFEGGDVRWRAGVTEVLLRG